MYISQNRNKRERGERESGGGGREDHHTCKMTYVQLYILYSVYICTIHVDGTPCALSYQHRPQSFNNFLGTRSQDSGTNNTGVTIPQQTS